MVRVFLFGRASDLTAHIASNNKFVMRADFQNNVDPNSRGRNSVRIQSHKAYDESLIILDLQHMPEGCATWPAFWSLSQKGPWPHGGEVDIIEGTFSVIANHEVYLTRGDRRQSPSRKPGVLAHLTQL